METHAPAVRGASMAWSSEAESIAPRPHSAPIEQPPEGLPATTEVPPEVGLESALLEQILGMHTDTADVQRHKLPIDLTQLRSLKRNAQFNPTAGEELKYLLAALVARLDSIVSLQINRILHDWRFQQLEASWRGLHYLVHQVELDDAIKVKVLNASWTDLARDADRAIEFDQSELFHKVYEQEFGIAGGDPFGVLIGDYQVRHQPAPGHPIDDIAVLTAISQVAAAAFAPFITAPHPSLLGLTSFSELDRPLNLARTFEQPEYLRWRAFREMEDARFIGLVVPSILMRLPHREDDFADAPFRFEEDVETPGAANYLWGNAAYAFGAVLIRAFSQAHWLTDIRGVRRGEDGGGIVVGLPVHSFETDADQIALKFSTNIAITDLQERALGDLGLIPFCPCKDTQLSAFYGNQSVQKPRTFAQPAATANARISAMLQYVLCASRIAHYLKVIGRDKIGSFIEPRALSDWLSNWLNKYTVDDANASPEVKAKYPLRRAEVNVRERPGKPGSFYCEMLLLPHSQWDELAMGLRLVTELTPPRGVER